MFIRGLHYKMREHLVLVNPNPNNLQNLFRDAINIENLTVSKFNQVVGSQSYESRIQ